MGRAVAVGVAVGVGCLGRGGRLGWSGGLGRVLGRTEVPAPKIVGNAAAVVKPQPDVTAVVVMRPGADVAGPQQVPVLVSPNRAVGLGPRTELVPIGKGGRDAAAAQHGPLRGIVSADQDLLRGGVVKHFEEPVVQLQW